MIKDNNGKEHDINVVYYCSKEFTVLVACDMPMDIPVASMIILSTGEIRAAMRDPLFRDNKEMTDVLIEAERIAIQNKVIVPSEGGLFSIIHPNHGTNKKFIGTAAELSVIFSKGIMWHRWFVPTEKILDGTVL
jgi:hypothetical protein